MSENVRVNVRVVVGHEPRFYREVLAEALRCLRPDAEIVLVEPRDLDGAIVRYCPHVVVCSHLSEAVRTRTLTWVLFYPNGENRAIVGLAGREHSIPGVEIADLLAIVDETERLAREAAEDHGAQPHAPDPGVGLGP